MDSGNAVARATTLSMVLLLASCSGGGGGGTPNPPPPSPAPTFTVGGTVSGLASNSVTLRLNGGADLNVGANGTFTFPGAIANGTAYTVTVQAQPTAPTQTCTLANATGTIAANVANVTVTCTTNTYRVRGTVAGLAGGSITLFNNGVDALTLSANGAFQFATAVPSGGAYAVTNPGQPVGGLSQSCVITQGSGTVAAADVTNVTVNCTINTFRVRGTLAGLAGGSVMLSNNGGNNLQVSANGVFQFSDAVPSGGVYAVTVHTQPVTPAQTCVVTQATGNVGAADITNVAVNCTVNTYSIGGTITGLNGSGLVLRNNGGNDLAVSANGNFTFSAPVASGGNYLVSVRTQPTAPHQRCTLVNAGGPVAAANITNVAITCVDTYAIGGTVSGLDVAGLVLRNSGGNDLTVDANGAFEFSERIDRGSSYNVTVVAGTPASPRHVCQVVDGTGANTNADVTNIDVNCEADRFAYVAHYRGVAYNGPSVISAYVANHQTGALAPIAGTSMFPTSEGAVAIVSDPRGRFVYVAHYISTSGNPSLIDGYSVNPATGALTPVPGSPFTAGTSTFSLAIDSEGNFLYAANNGSSDISAWTIQSNGSLVAVPGSPFSTGFQSGPVSIATSVDQQCCYVYVALSLGLNNTGQLAAFHYHSDTGVLTPVANSPYHLPSAYTPASVAVNPTGELVWLGAGGTSNITTMDIAGGIGGGLLSERPGSPTSVGNSMCTMFQPRLSPTLFVASHLSYAVWMYGTDPNTGLPEFLDGETMFVGAYCSIASDPYGRFVYLPNVGSGAISDYLFGFEVVGSSLQPLTLSNDPPAPVNTYTMPAISPRAMVLRYSRRDREVMFIPE